MSEVDYQMALLLQYKFEQEHKNKQNTDSDQQLALELQQQFQAEAEIERPSNNLVYKAPTLNSSKCLVDPSWEVIDPTPDIHVLFTAFNQKFFWNTLGSVTVSWSKKMTTCAGICSYQGRGGMCSITLSEPLLKLRPRKDLVETLLHEMIHAYLFVTNNNRDRDGHGPEFHKHMYRINAEAGTNITVYHDFHDEVRLYQQHWWRCNGPCQTQKPYFGMLRRATNREPGPSDRWWADHMRNCGGSFIKVKSPEAKTLNKKTGHTSKPPDPKNDIRNYIPTSSKAPIPKPIKNNKENKTITNFPKPRTKKKGIPDFPKPISSTKSNGTNSQISNIHTVSDNSASTPQVSNVIPSKTSNIFGFTNLNGRTASTSHVPKNPGSTSGVKGAVKNAGSSTFVVTKKGGNSLENSNGGNIGKTSPSTSNIQVFNGTGRSLSTGSSSSSSNSDYSKVREHWLKKFGNSEQNKSIKENIKRSNTSLLPNSQKVPRLSVPDIPDDKNKNRVECPVCKKKFEVEELNFHLDICLKSPPENIKQCFICSAAVPIQNFEKHVSECSQKHFNDDFEDNDVFSDSTQCPLCLKRFEPQLYIIHKKNCEESKVVDLTRLDSTEENKNCPVCKEALSPIKYDVHVEQCLLKMCDEFDAKYEQNKDTKTSCLACNREILKSELNSHLEDCMSISNVFETSNATVEGDDEDVKEADNVYDKNDKDDRYNCPFCLKLISENEMQSHLDICLNIENCSKENAEEKSLLVESLCGTDSDNE